MTLNARKSSLRTLVVLLHTKRARLRLVAALIAVALAFTVHSGAKAFAEARQAVLYVTAPSVPAAAVRDAAQISRSYADTVPSMTLRALGFSPETARDYAIERALASVLQPPPEDAQMALTEAAALEAGRIYVAQRSGRLPPGGEQEEEYASTGPVRPELGDGTVVEVQEDWSTSPDSPPVEPSERSAGSEDGYPDEEPVSMDGGVQIAYTDSPGSSGGVVNLAEDPTWQASSGLDIATVDGEPVELAASTEKQGSGSEGSSSMTGPVADTEQVPTTLAGEEMDSTAEEEASDGASEDTPSEGGSPEQRTSSNRHSGGPSQEPSRGGGEEPVVALVQEPEQRSARTSGEQGLPDPQPSSSNTPAEDDPGGPAGGGQPELAAISTEAVTEERGAEVRAGDPPPSVLVAQDKSVERGTGGRSYAVIALSSGEDSGDGSEGAQAAGSPARGPDVYQATTSVAPELQAGTAPPAPSDLAPPEEDVVPPSGPPDAGKDGVQLRLLVGEPAEESNSRQETLEAPVQDASDENPSGRQLVAETKPLPGGRDTLGGAPELSSAPEENPGGFGPDGTSAEEPPSASQADEGALLGDSPSRSAPDGTALTVDGEQERGSDTLSSRHPSWERAPRIVRAEDGAADALQRQDKPDSGASGRDGEASGTAPGAGRSPSTSGFLPQPEARPAPDVSPQAADRRTAIARDRGRVQVEVTPQQQTTEGRQSITQAREPAGEASKQDPPCEPTRGPVRGERAAADGGEQRTRDNHQQRT